MKSSRTLRFLVVILTLAISLVVVYPAVAAPSNQPGSTAIAPGVYAAAVEESDATPAMILSLYVLSNGNAGLKVESPSDGSVLKYFGAWTENKDGSISATLSEDENGPLDEPIELNLELKKGDLVGAVLDVETVTFKFDQSEEELLASLEAAPGVPFGGIYASTILMRDDDSSLFVLIYHLADDGTAQAVMNSFDGKTPATTLSGAWSIDAPLSTDNTVPISTTVVITLTDGVSYTGDGMELTPLPEDEVGRQSFSVLSHGELLGSGATLYPLAQIPSYLAALDAVSAPANRAPSAGPNSMSYEAHIAASDQMPALTVLVTFNEDGSAIMDTTADNDPTQQVTETGTWEPLKDGNLSLTITGAKEGAYDKPIEYEFSVSADGKQLEAVVWDTELHGEEAPVFDLIEEASSSSK